MSKMHLIIADQHAHPSYGNERADWIGQLIKDIKPDVVVNLGDAADMSSMSSYDKGKRSFQGKTYAADINAHLDFQDRMWEPIRRTKKKLPYAVVLEGNHEHRIERALDLSPELAGTIGFNDFEFEYYYNDVVRYAGGTPGVVKLDGVNYAHYFVSGLMGRGISGEHPAHSLLVKQGESCTMGHTHVVDFSVRTTASGKKNLGLIAGVYQDYDSDWAGNICNLWWRGVIIKHGVEDGMYDPEFVSLERLRRAYG